MRGALSDATLLAFQEAAFVPEHWSSALTCLSQATASSFALLQVVDQASHRGVASDGLGTEIIHDYFAEGWHAHNVRMERGMTLTKRGARGLITERQMLTEEELATHPFQQEFARRFGLECEAGILLAREGGTSFILTMQRGARVGSYTPDELRIMNELVARLKGAATLAIRTKLSSAIEGVDMLVRRCGAVALLAQSGFALFASPTFEGLIGDAITLIGGRVAAVDQRADAALQAAIAETAAWSAACPTATRPVVLRRPAGPPVLARLHPVAGAARDYFGLAKVMLTLDDMSRPPPSPLPDILIQAFDLTPTEARLASRIGEAMTLREAAAAERITYETARTRLKKVFDKTGTSSQAALALLVGRFGP